MATKSAKMPGSKPFTVELKESLLEYLLELSEDWDGDSPDIRIFWHTVERDFEGARNTTWHGKDFEQKMEREEETWLEECEDPEKKRRRGHEKDSNYDKLMAKWCDIWNGMLRKHWQYMVDTEEEQFETVPDEFKQYIKLPEPKFEYDGAKLERVVAAAMERAREAGKHDLAAAVEQVYKDALQERKLRILLEAILTQRADRQQNEEFQAYVKIAKQKIKDARERANLTANGAATAPPQAQGTQQQPQASTAATATPSVPAASTPAAAATAPLPTPVSVPASSVPASSVPASSAPASAPAPASVAPAQAASASSAATAMPPPSQPKQSTPTAAKTSKATPKGKSPASKTTSSTSKANPKVVPNALKTPTQAPPQPALGRPSTATSVTLKPAQTTVTATVTTKPSQSNATVPPKPAAAKAPVNPRIEAILGQLQHVPSAQMVLLAAPDIGDSRLEVLKSILLSHPETMTDFQALAARLEKEDAQTAEAQASAGASRPHRVNAGKKRRNSAGESSMAEAEQDDLAEAQRAAKRRRGEGGEDDGGDYQPGKAVRDRARKKQKKSSSSRPGKSQSASNSNTSRESSALSDLPDEMDMESTKSAYVDELVQRRTAEEANNAIVAQYGPVSPSHNGDAGDDWTSMASPTLDTIAIDDRVPSPPPEPANPLHLISDAASQAIARDPGINRLEAKLDSLIHLTNPGAAVSSGPSNGKTTAEMNVANSETLKDIATVLRNADMQTARPEFTRLVLQLTHNAAEAAIHSAEAAKKAGEMARDVSLVLQQLGVKGLSEHPATPLSED